MKFETILDMLIRSSEKFGALTVEEYIRDEYQVFITQKKFNVWRQRAAFRARLVEMYAHSNGTLKGATRQERTVARACDELGIDYIADWNSPTDPDRGER